MRLLIITLFLFSLSSSYTQTRTGQDYAIFFANDNYRSNRNFDNLKNPIRDAKTIAKELEEMYGFQTEVYENKDKNYIFNKLEQWHKHSFRQDDQLFIFFSGHGTFWELTKKGYFVPKSSSTDYAQYIDLTDLGNIVTQIPCRHILLVVDACYSGIIDQKITFKGNSFKRSSSNTMMERDNIVYRQLQHKTRLLITSGGKERTPDGDDYSPFAKAILKELHAGIINQYGLVIYQDLLSQLERISPTPYIGELNGHKQGGFVFVAKDMIPPPPIQPDNFIFVKGGSFQMGSDSGESNEKPVHQVTLSDFYIGRYEVTVDEYLAFARATNTHFPEWMEKNNKYNIQTGSKDYYKKFGNALTKRNHPIVGISWYDAVAYCNWLSQKRGLRPVYTINGSNISANWQANGYRLPTEAEWEYAARSRGKSDKWAGTSNESDLSNFGNFCDQNCTKSWKDETQGDRYKFTAPVGYYQSNSLGLYDMSGNVWEWCWDWYDTKYYGKNTNTNPKGPDTGSYRVLRGGSWLGLSAYLRCANRNESTPGYLGYGVGFRLSRAGY